MTKQKTALVTGANRSIGFEIARRLAAEGYRVWIGSRDVGRGEEAARKLRDQGLDAHVLQLDVTSDESVASAIAELSRQTDHLDALVNNAGIADSFTHQPFEEPIEVVKAVYEVNTFGPIRLTQAALPLLKASGAGRVVMLSSELGSLQALLDPQNQFYGINALGYNSSKTALNAVTVSFAKAAEPFGIKVNAADPGYTKTDMNGHSGYRTVEQAAEAPVRLAMLGPDGPTAGYFFDDHTLPW
ncbi:SDR family oxidoreductase [Neorhizobium galegae]|uniref:SDR family oxidoreductase n=1 Tax=Neorhizobium galegae TaxID=399 RepID=UPI000621AAE6|nr:SDR family oxidoreductase [Neorhizobium galegae]CDZ26281.1 Short chain dehydrogenase [Neorhizobium galegae bv. officinalis]MCM2499729.1 SDR family oxidoreductase [Neorhizobium galegae]MCQ1773087.1 SDR family oxidoreductase [Neorhizobium galegae]MCQ1776866.1 SDR family oxidoreductase [Neorhizobium galegae]MCQ1793669.1 SDR family oxidoreductase [Neorhizobium galegae]